MCFRTIKEVDGRVLLLHMNLDSVYLSKETISS